MLGGTWLSLAKSVAYGTLAGSVEVVSSQRPQYLQSLSYLVLIPALALRSPTNFYDGVNPGKSNGLIPPITRNLGRKGLPPPPLGFARSDQIGELPTNHAEPGTNLASAVSKNIGRHMRPLTALLLAFVVFWGMSARAQDEKDCYRSDIETGHCLIKVLKNADANLKESYKYARHYLPPQDRANLMTAQRAWMAYRNAACKVEYAMAGDDKKFRTLCLIRITKQRTAEIEDLYSCVGPPSDNFPEAPIVPVQTDLRSLPLK